MDWFRMNKTRMGQVRIMIYKIMIWMRNVSIKIVLYMVRMATFRITFDTDRIRFYTVMICIR